MPEDHSYGAGVGYGQPVDGIRHPAQHHSAHHAHAQAHHQTPKPLAGSAGPWKPLPVVKMLSARGMEYAMMSVALWIFAIALGWISISLVNGNRSFSFLVVPTAALIVSLPIYIGFFIRLKRAEARSPKLRLDPSRRRWSQLTQFLSYIVLLVNLIAYVYQLLLRYGADKTGLAPLGRVTADAGVVLLISFILLAYYWVDEHQLSQE